MPSVETFGLNTVVDEWESDLPPIFICERELDFEDSVTFPGIPDLARIPDGFDDVKLLAVKLLLRSLRTLDCDKAPVDDLLKACLLIAAESILYGSAFRGA